MFRIQVVPAAAASDADFKKVLLGGLRLSDRGRLSLIELLKSCRRKSLRSVQAPQQVSRTEGSPGADPDRKTLAGVCDPVQTEDASTQNRGQSLGQLGSKLFEGLCVVGGMETIVCQQQHLPGMETHSAAQNRIGFQSAAGQKRVPENLPDTLLTGPVQILLAVVEESGPVIALVQAEVSLVSDQQYAGAPVDVTVVVDVDEQVSVDGLVLDPGMEDGDEFPRLGPEGLLQKDLETQFLPAAHTLA
jgi:membrane-associated protease RseP (regulator of RpoE activity)